VFGGQTFGGTYFAGMFPWLQERVRRVTGWGPPAVASAPAGRGVLIQPRPLLTRAVGRPPEAPPPGVTNEELLVIAGLMSV
jgi:hypothetical protein